MKRSLRVVISLLFIAGCDSARNAPLPPREQALRDLIDILPPSNRNDTARINAVDRSWEEWVKRTGELPPDFARMKSIPELPDPLAGVKTKAQWDERRRWIRAQFEQWVFGRMPPRPDNLSAVVTGAWQEGGMTVRDVRLEFGPAHRATLRLQLLIPPGDRPAPVFLTNHPRASRWVAPAVRRGYIGCIFYAADPRYGDKDDSDAYIEIYPEYDFSCLARWAWAAMRAVDYLYTMPEVDKTKIAISGHSRNAKMALLAAAFDERIAAAVPSSGNTGEGNPWRYTTDSFANESIEQITGEFPGWFHPRLRFFAGREDKLPVDQNSLIALVAPRGLLMTSAYSESEGGPFGYELAYRSTRRVYQFLNADDKLGLHLRPGEHPTTVEDLEQYVDFLDRVFGRGRAPAPRTFIPDNNYREQRVTAPPRSAPIRERILWALGEKPPGVNFPMNARKLSGTRVMTSDWLAAVLNRPLRIEGVASAIVTFGDGLKADLYYPANAKGKLPVVIWLHPYAYATGYSRYAKPTIEALAARGYAALCFDQIGFGTRIHQAKAFYDRYPRWSLLGKMVADTRAAIDAVSAIEELDASRVYLAGYSLGGKVAIWTAALDDRVKAVVAASAFTPLRAVSAETEGLRHYTYLHNLLPRFGPFIGREKNLPIDYDEILEAIAPRPVYLRAPLLDRYADPEAVRAAARGSHITLDIPRDFNRLPLAAQQKAFDWLAERK